MGKLGANIFLIVTTLNYIWSLVVGVVKSDKGKNIGAEFTHLYIPSLC